MISNIQMLVFLCMLFQYPDGYLEAQALKEKEKEESDTPKGKGKGKRKRKDSDENEKEGNHKSFNPKAHFSLHLLRRSCQHLLLIFKRVGIFLCAVLLHKSTTYNSVMSKL